MRMWAAKNFIFTSLHILLCANCYFIVFYFHYYYANYYYYFFSSSVFRHLSTLLLFKFTFSCTSNLTVTSEDVCRSIRNVK